MSSNDQDSGEQKPKRLKTLSDVGLPQLTPEEQEAFEARLTLKVKAQRDAWYKWSEEEVIRFIEALKEQRPEIYAEYIQQEKDLDEYKIDQIDMELSVNIKQLSILIFPNVTNIDRGNLFGEVRTYVRRSLNLTRE